MPSQLRQLSYDPAVIQEYRRRSSMRWVMVVVMCTVVVIYFTVSRTPDAAFLGWKADRWAPALLGAFVGTVVLYLRHWRCPACKLFLGNNTNPPTCPGCGTAFRE